TRAAAESDRYGEIRRLIKKNLHFSAHMTWAVTTHTIAAVRPQVTEADSPVLLRMLGDAENVVGIGAQHVLAALGDPAVPGVETGPKATAYRVRRDTRAARA